MSPVAWLQPVPASSLEGVEVKVGEIVRFVMEDGKVVLNARLTGEPIERGDEIDLPLERIEGEAEGSGIEVVRSRRRDA
jgi:hypothetical protein